MLPLSMLAYSHLLKTWGFGGFLGFFLLFYSGHKEKCDFTETARADSQGHVGRLCPRLYITSGHLVCINRLGRKCAHPHSTYILISGGSFRECQRRQLGGFVWNKCSSPGPEVKNQSREPQIFSE